MKKSMIVAGIMSGTSADGIDVAIVRIATGPNGPRLKLLAHHAERYPAKLRTAVLAAMNATSTSAAELARLHWRLGLAYAESVTAAVTQSGIRPDLIGSHGQTIYHQGNAQPYLGQHFACTWQLGEASVIAAKIGVPVVSNFRPADMAAGGQGAPLVPFLDYTLFRRARRARVLQNLGGIGNLTVIPPNATPDDLLAFDTGPANMIIDALMERLYAKRFDRNGAVARRGRVIPEVIATLLRDPYFAAAPPKSCGREQYGIDYMAQFLSLCQEHSNRPEDAIATATAFTAETIADAWKRFVAPRIAGQPTDYIVAGGGAQNPILMHMLKERLTPLGARMLTTDDIGLPAQAKEAAAFALLAWQTWHRQPSNIPAATGAERPTILGQVTYV